MLSLPDSELERRLRAIPRARQIQIARQLKGHATVAERAKDCPISMAETVSRGYWNRAKHLELISSTIREAIDHNRRTKERRIVIIEAPPRHGKSEFCSKYFPSWYLGKYPDNRVMLASYEANFARSWGRKVRTIIEEFGQSLFGVTVSDAQQAAVDWEIAGHRGGMVTAGVGGPMTGRGADLLIVDDPIKNAEEAVSETIRESHWDWWQSTASTRIEPGGTAVIIATRWHTEDLSGRVIQDAERMGGESMPVVRVRLPAIAGDGDQLNRQPGQPLWPDRWPLKLLERRRDELDPYWWLALYQQEPTGDLHADWPATYFGPSIWFDDWPAPSEIVNRVVSVDPSLGKTDKADFSAIVKLAKDIHGVYWIEADLDRRPSARIVNDGLDHYRALDAVALGCETNQFQELLGQSFDAEAAKRGMNVWFCGINNHTNKMVRIRSLSPLLAAGRIRFKRASRGTQLLVDQLRGFPLANHDDGPDALEMAVRLCEHILRGQVVESDTYEQAVA